MNILSRYRLPQAGRLLVAAALLHICCMTALAAPKPAPVDPPGNKKIDKSIARGVVFLLESQNKDGSWGSPRRTKGLNIYAPVPGSHRAFRCATTSLCIAALIEAGSADKDVEASLGRAETWLIEHLPNLRRATPMAIYNTWAHGYGIHALVKMYNRESNDAKRRERIKKVIDHQVGMLQRYEFVNGGWGYYNFGMVTKKPSGDPTSFTTSTILIALSEAKQIGIHVPDKMTQRALATVVRQRTSGFSYVYSERSKYRPARLINRPSGALGRAQVCNLACRVWGDKRVTDAVLREWLDRLSARNLWLDIGRKRPVPHEAWAQVAGYFYFYGHYYAAQCIEQLPPATRGPFQDQLATIILRLQEKDGSWWDFPFFDYHQPYGTAFAVSTLVRCRRAEAVK